MQFLTAIHLKQYTASNMNQVVAQQKTLQTILNRLEELSREIKYIKGRLKETEPPYGSEAWWRWAEKKADEDIAAGRYKTYKDVKALVKDLHQGK